MSFSAPSFDARRPVMVHAVSVRVTPAIALGASSVANPTVLATLTPHGMVTGDTAAVLGHLGSTPAVDGAREVTVLDALHVSVPVAVTVAGAGGTLTRTIAVAPLSLADAKLYARLTGSDLNDLLPGFISSAVLKVRADTGIVLLLDTFDVYFDALPWGRVPIALPWRPVPLIASFASIDRADVRQTLDVSQYVLDPSSEAPVSARVALSTMGAWPTDLRSFQPYVLQLIAGWSSIALIPAPLVHAVGLLVDYIVNKDAIALAQYEETIAPFRLVSLA